MEELEKEYETEDSNLYKSIDVFEQKTSSEDDMEEKDIVKEEVVEETPVVETTVEPAEEIKIERTVTVDIAESVADEDELELEDDTDSDKIDEEEANRYVEIIRAEVSKRIKPVSKKMDISGFTIASQLFLSRVS